MHNTPREVRWNEYGYGTSSNGWARKLSQQRIRSSLVAADHGPQAHCAALSALDYVLLFYRGLFRAAHPARTADSGRRPGPSRHVQQVIHHAWHGDGFLFPDSFDPGSAGEFPGSVDDWGEGSGISPHQPAELVPVHHWRRDDVALHVNWRRRHRLDVLHAFQHSIYQYQDC